MAERNERYDSDLTADIDKLEKMYFREAEPGTPTETKKTGAKRQSATRSAPRRRSASNASRARQTTSAGKTSSGKSHKNPFADRTGKGKKTKKP